MINHLSLNSDLVDWICYNNDPLTLSNQASRTPFDSRCLPPLLVLAYWAREDVDSSSSTIWLVWDTPDLVVSSHPPSQINLNDHQIDVKIVDADPPPWINAGQEWIKESMRSPLGVGEWIKLSMRSPLRDVTPLWWIKLSMSSPLPVAREPFVQ